MHLALDPPDLVGAWELTRVIVDHAADEKSRVAGVTTLTPEDDGRIRWAESGTLYRRDAEIPVSRILFLEQRTDGWYVTFEDGRDFHPWLPGRPVEHACSPDLYTGTVEFLDGDNWSVEWRVTGPNKDYTMSSALIRAIG